MARRLAFAVAKQYECPAEHAEQAQIEDLTLSLAEVTSCMSFQVLVVDGHAVIPILRRKLGTWPDAPRRHKRYRPLLKQPQIQIATDHVKGCLARLAGIEPPKWADDESTLDELRARIRKAIEYAQSIPPAKVDGSEAREIELPVGPGRTMKFPGETFLKSFSLPNFFFHTTMMYALLRQGGVDLGKMDYLGAP